MRREYFLFFLASFSIALSMYSLVAGCGGKSMTQPAANGSTDDAVHRRYAAERRGSRFFLKR